MVLSPASQEQNSAYSSDHSVSPWCLPLLLLLLCIYRVCVCVNQREVCAVDRSSISPLVLWVKMQTDYWRAQLIHPWSKVLLHVSVCAYMTNMRLITWHIILSNWCVSVYGCTCHKLHGLIGITHNVTANQFYKRTVHKSLFIYYPLSVSDTPLLSVTWLSHCRHICLWLSERIRRIKEVQRNSVGHALIDRQPYFVLVYWLKWDNPKQGLGVKFGCEQALFFSKWHRETMMHCLTNLLLC